MPRRVLGALSAGGVVCLCWLAIAGSASAVGGLTPVAGSPFAAGPAVASLTFSASGALLANVNEGTGDSVSVFSVASGGALAPVTGSPFAVGQELSDPGPESMTFSPDGRLAVTANFDNSVSVFAVGPGGALAPVAGSPFGGARVTGPYPTSIIAPEMESVAFSPDGSFVAAAHGGFPGSVSVFSVGSGGALAPVAGSPFATGSQPTSVAFSPNGTLLATADAGAGTASVFSVGSGGALVPVTGSPFPIGPSAAAASPGSVAFDPNGRLLATANSDHTVSVFSVGTEGALEPVAGSPFASEAANTVDGPSPSSVAFSPDGRLVATTSYYDGTVSLLSVGSHGTLTSVVGSPFAVGSSPDSVSFSPNGGLLAAGNFATGTVAVFSVGRVVVRAPADVTPPKITRAHKTGNEVRCSTGSWTNNPTSFTFRWYRNHRRRAGATGSTYRLRASDDGTSLRCVVTAANAGGHASASSKAINVPSRPRSRMSQAERASAMTRTT